MKSAPSFRPPGRGPFRADQLRPGDPYELSDGHAIVSEPAGRRHGRRNLAGGAALETDPAVAAAGVDVGHVLDELTLRAPDVSVGGFSDEPGFASGAPTLAVEYVETGRDETDLARKIAQLLAAGTAVVWVVRLGDERRVEVHRSGEGIDVKRSGEILAAPGILRNPLPVDALYDSAAAHEAMLRNLLQRSGYDDLDAVRAEGRAEGRVEGRVSGRIEGEARGRAEGALTYARTRLRRTLAARGIAITVEHDRTIDACSDLDTVDAWLEAAFAATSAADVFGSR